MVSRQLIQFGAILCLVAMVSFSVWPFWQWLNRREAAAELQERVRVLAEKNPHLKAALKIAMQDNVLTYDEAKEIIEAAGEKVEPEK